jgi:hypothetical protein
MCPWAPLDFIESKRCMTCRLLNIPVGNYNAQPPEDFVVCSAPSILVLSAPNNMFTFRMFAGVRPAYLRLSFRTWQAMLGDMLHVAGRGLSSTELSSAQLSPAQRSHMFLRSQKLYVCTLTTQKSPQTDMAEL